MKEFSPKEPKNTAQFAVIQIFFPFLSKEYNYLELERWHRFFKVLYFAVLAIIFIISMILYLNAKITTVISPNFEPTGRWTYAAYQDTINQMPETEFDIKYSTLTPEMKHTFLMLRSDVYAMIEQLGSVHEEELKPLYTELFYLNNNFGYYVGYYIQILVYTIITTYLLGIILQLIYYKGLIYVLYGDDKKTRTQYK